MCEPFIALLYCYSCMNKGMGHNDDDDDDDDDDYIEISVQKGKRGQTHKCFQSFMSHCSGCHEKLRAPESENK